MRYAMSSDLEQPLDEVVPLVKQALSANGFGVVAEIDMQETGKDKIGADIEPHLILGVSSARSERGE